MTTFSKKRCNMKALQALSAASLIMSEMLLQKSGNDSANTPPNNDDELLPALLDRHGTGRVLFRNVRESVEGFRERILKPYELPAEQFPTENAAAWNSKDARIGWLAELLKLSDDKHLIICSRAETAIALDKYLRDRTTIRSVAFHEAGPGRTGSGR